MCVESILRNVRVLYVEDDEVTQIIVRQMLKSMVGKVYTASDGVEGLKMYEKHKPDLVITDLIMPEMDGLELIKRIRKFDSECGLLITTEINELNRILKSIEIGIDQYMVKPIEKNDLEEALQGVIRKLIKRSKEDSKIESLVGMDKNWETQVTDDIKSRISTYIKTLTKKGPTAIHVLVKENYVFVKMKGTLTQLEKSLLTNVSNNRMVSYNREVLYREFQGEIESLVYESIERKATLETVKIEPLTDEEEWIIKFEIV
ncbi:Na-translocating system protein MpsC family protein [Fusibacter sp. JL216-2]|uniref:Na-translocating system protein MpsC family protein n=1 Tax=Fusibacter sp. JL216-2 TaxID=3071453 RepID=UPI003D34ED4E